MQSNLSVTSYRPTFGINVSEKVIDLGSKCNSETGRKLYKKIDKLKTYGFKNHTIGYKQNIAPSGKSRHVFYAEKDGEEYTLISEYTIQKAINQLINLTKYDLQLKIK